MLSELCPKGYWVWCEWQRIVSSYCIVIQSSAPGFVVDAWQGEFGCPPRFVLMTLVGCMAECCCQLLRLSGYQRAMYYA